MSIINFCRKKTNAQRITMVTCYDYTSAKILAQTDIDALLVGDTLAMTMHGFEQTTAATLDMMAMHTAAVARGAKNKFIISDLPFLSYRKSLSEAMSAIQCLIQAGGHAVKLESSRGNLELVRHATESGVPVMGHLGLMPQFFHAVGGHRLQAKDQQSAERLLQDALDLQAAGCFAVVLECIPASVARKVTEQLMIPTIGIGAGPHTDGQILVLQDLLGLSVDFNPKFVKAFANGQSMIQQGIKDYVAAVVGGDFPDDQHSY